MNRESKSIDACMGVVALVGTEKETAVHCPFYWRGAGGPMRWCYSNVILAQCCYYHEQAEQLWWSCQSSLGLNACRSTGPGKCFCRTCGKALQSLWVACDIAIVTGGESPLLLLYCNHIVQQHW